MPIATTKNNSGFLTLISAPFIQKGKASLNWRMKFDQPRPTIMYLCARGEPVPDAAIVTFRNFTSGHFRAGI